MKIIRVLIFFSFLSFANLVHTADLIPGALYAPPPDLDIGMVSAVIQKILTHLDDNAASAATALLPDCRASPIVGLFV